MDEYEHDAEVNRVDPEQWVSFIVGDVVGIATCAAVGSVPVAVAIAGAAYLGLFLVMRARRLRRAG